MGKYIVFEVGTEEYGLAIENIQSIEALKPITPLPEMKAYISGVSNIKGTVTPIINMRKVIGLDSQSNSNGQKILLVYEGESVLVY